MKRNFLIVKVSLPLPIDRSFDYRVDFNLSKLAKIGSRVDVEFNKRRMVGFITAFAKKSRVKNLKRIINVLDEKPIIQEDIFRLAKKIAESFVCSLGQALEILLPHQIRKSKFNFFGQRDISGDKTYTVCTEEKNKILYVRYDSYSSLFEYLKSAVEEQIARNKNILILVPDRDFLEIATKQFDKIDVDKTKMRIWYGGFSKDKMLSLWQEILSGQIRILIGTRSLVFAPLKNIGLFFILDENNKSYKSEQTPFYNTREVAIMRSQIENFTLVLSSLVPSGEVYKMVLEKKIGQIELDNQHQLRIQLSFAQTNYRDTINPIIQKQIEESLSSNKKLLIFLNKKGFATHIFCKKCKTDLQCPRCSVSLRYDYATKELCCPYCSYKIQPIEICPKCNSEYVRYSGIGIEKLASIFSKHFPQARIITIDQLSKNAILENQNNVIIASQLIFKNIDFKPDQTIVWNLDQMLNISDYRTFEDTFYILYHLANITKERLTICTNQQPNFYIFKALKKLDFSYFYEEEFKTRRQLKQPPFYYNTVISIRSTNQKNSKNASKRLYDLLVKKSLKNVEITQPFLPARYKIRDKYYYQILIKSKSIKTISSALKQTLAKINSNKTIASVNVNPI